MGSIFRGPPCKSKQSEHPLWVGNLPPRTTIVDLKSHFSRDGTKKIESLFLVSKSNYAFVNYRSDAIMPLSTTIAKSLCAAAMRKIS